MILTFLTGRASADAWELQAGERFSSASNFQTFSGVRTDQYTTSPAKTDSIHNFSELSFHYLADPRGKFTRGLFLNFLLPRSSETTTFPTNETSVRKKSTVTSFNFGLSFQRRLWSSSEERNQISIGLEPSLGLFHLAQTWQSSSTGNLSAFAWSYRVDGLLTYRIKVSPKTAITFKAGYAYNPSSSYWVESSSGAIYSDLSSNKRIYLEGKNLRTDFSGLVASIGFQFLPAPEAKVLVHSEEDLSSGGEKTFDLPLYRLIP